MPSSLVGYTDESGNTGIHLFDSSQPYFWTGTLLASEEFADSAKLFVENWCDKFGLKELHGNELGLPRIDRLASDLELLLDSVDSRFVFTVLEKSHFAATKFVDTFFDCGINEAVSPLYYNTRLLRLHIACVVSMLMEIRDLECFWNAYKSGDCRGFRDSLENLDQKVTKFVQDDRTKQVLSDAIGWAFKHPERFIGPPVTEIESPNAVSIGLLVGALQAEYDETGRRLMRLIHDDTNQFGLAIKAVFGFYRKLASVPEIPDEIFSDTIELDTVNFSVEMQSSSSTHSLQIIDIVLWTVKRFWDRNELGFPACEKLLSTVFERSQIQEFTQHGLEDEVSLLWEELMKQPVTEAELRQGSEVASLLESRRVDRMSKATHAASSVPPPNRRRTAKAMKSLLRNLATGVEE